jgi:hypothetical protein
VRELGVRFMQQEAAHFEGWSRAIGLTGLQVYGLFVSQPEWLTRAQIFKAVDDPKVPVSRALTALCYHGLIVPNQHWGKYCRGGELFGDWYIQEIPRLSQELEVKSPDLPPPPFWIQLQTQGPLQAAFGHHIAMASNGASASVAGGSHNVRIGQRGQKVRRSYDAAGSSEADATCNDQDQIVRRLKKIEARLADLEISGAIDPNTAIDISYDLKKVLLELRKCEPDWRSVVNSLNRVKKEASLGEGKSLVPALSQATGLVKRFIKED